MESICNLVESKYISFILVGSRLDPLPLCMGVTNAFFQSLLKMALQIDLLNMSVNISEIKGAFSRVLLWFMTSSPVLSGKLSRA